MRVLFIEDEIALAKVVSTTLGRAGLNVFTAHSGEDGIDLCKSYEYDIILLDLSLPDMHGYEVLRTLRAAGVATPVLILSGQCSTEAKVRTLGLGADEYVTKPFHSSELIARIQAVIRRSQGHSQSIIHTGKLAVNLDEKTVEFDGKPVPVTKKEYAILELLSLRKGATLSKEALLDDLYGGLDEPVQKIIDVFVCLLRKKLSAASGGEQFIQTEWGRGYALKEPQAPLALAA